MRKRKNILLRWLIFLSLLFIGNMVFAQNIYIQTDMVKQAGATSDALVNTLPLNGVETSREYFNGLGTPLQSVVLQGSPVSGRDIIQPYQYDATGQQAISYLPYIDNNTANASGSYRSTALTDQSTYYLNSGTSANPNKVANNALAFSQKVFENSPLHRLMDAGTDGTGLQPNTSDPTQHYSSVAYRTNSSSDNVLNIAPTGSAAAYGPNALSVTDYKDADAVETLIFKNSLGQTILKRQKSGNTTGEIYYDTYYLYNPNGSISTVIPPKAAYMISSGTNTNMSAAPLSNLIYSYTYDNIGRLITRQAPNTGLVSIVYDTQNRPVLVQDGNLAVNNQWYYIKYDSRSRPISQGIYTDNTTSPISHIGQLNMQNYVYTTGSNYFESRSANASTYYYTDNCFPTQNIQPLGFAFYDDYDLTQTVLPGTSTFTPDYQYVVQGLTKNGTSIEATSTTLTQGLLTMVMQCSVGSGLSGIWLTHIYFYDKRGNTIQVQSNNHINYQPNLVTDYRTTAPDFIGKPLQTLVNKMTGTITNPVNNKILTTFTYDAQNKRIQTISQTYNTQAPVTIANYTYNDLGQLVTKQLGYSNVTGLYLQTLDYRYNIRNQITTINNSTLANDGGLTNGDNTDLFGLTYLYDIPDPNLTNEHASYSGRISAVKWINKYYNNTTGTTVESNERSYAYQYNAVGEITNALYAERLYGSGSTTSFTVNPGGFDESGMNYDDDGNLSALTRNYSSNNGSGGIALDKLNYLPDPNNPDRVYTISDAVNTTTPYGFNNITGSTANYQYDPDGNLKIDPYKGITIGYNSIDKTDNIQITTPSINNGSIYYTYDAGGNILRKQINNNGSSVSVNDYLDEFVYNNGTLSYVTMPEGRVVYSGGTLTPQYVIADQQGNARLSFSDNGSGSPTILQENSYYAFGAVMPNSLVQPPVQAQPLNNNLFNGQSEWQNAFSNLPDYYQAGSRNYDPEIGRFISVDPMAESSASMTTYQYAGNNPIMNNDPTGNTISAATTFCAEWEPDAPDQGGNSSPTASVGSGGGNDIPSAFTINAYTPPSNTSIGGIYNNSVQNNYFPYVTINGFGPPPVGLFNGNYPLDFSGANSETTTGYSSTSTDLSSTSTESFPALGYYGSNGSYTSSSSNSGSANTESANQGSNDMMVNYSVTNLTGATSTGQNGWRFEKDDGVLLDKIEIRTYKETTLGGKEGIFNINHTAFTDQFGEVHNSADANLSLGFLHIRGTNNAGISIDAGVGEYFNLSLGLSGGDGVTIGGTVNGYGGEISARPGIGTAAAAIITVLSGGAAWAW